MQTIATHPEKSTIAFHLYKGGVLFAAAYSLTNRAELDRVGFLSFINGANKDSTIARFYWSEEEKAMLMEAWYPKAYEKIAFGEFFEKWLNDSSYFWKEEKIGRIYLE